MPTSIECPTCNGIGEVPNEVRLWKRDGRILRSARIDRRWSSRVAAKILNIKPSELLSMENGNTQPDFSILAEYDAY